MRKGISPSRSHHLGNRINDFKSLLRYINHLAKHKLGYPVSLLTYLGIVDNTSLGIKPHSLANVLLNNVGDPFKDSETSLMEVKRHERELIAILEKYYGLKPGEARGYVTTGGTEGNFAGLWWSKRFLISCAVPKLIAIDDGVKLRMKEEQQLMADLQKIPRNETDKVMQQLQKIVDMKNLISASKAHIQEILTPTVFYSKNHTHYSIPKISEILHLNIRPVAANADGSINITDFHKELLINLKAHPSSPIIVIANIGTTITGAIDDVPSLKKLLDEVKSANEYTIHLDGALTGFVMPILKPFGDVPNYFSALGANTLAVSAHKYPGLSQPCGILMARKYFFEKAFDKSERSIDYVGNILDVTITGSRSGLNVLMFYNALRSLGLHKNTDKLARMVNKNLNNAKYLYQKLVALYDAHRVSYLYHFNVTFPKTSLVLAKKYQLMLTGDTATICVLTNVTRKLIDQFIKDLNLEKEKIMTNKILSDYKIITLAGEYAKSVVDLLVHSFCDSEPITKHLGIQYEEYIPFATEVVQKAIKEGLSKVAVDEKNKVIACAIAEDLADPFFPKLTHYPKLRPILQLLNELSKPFLAGRKFAKGKIIHIWIVAVDPDYRGHHISTEIDLACVENAARKGFDFAYAEFTNELSEKVTKQFNILQLCNRINYSDFHIDRDHYPFKGLKGAAASYLATIRPGVKMDYLSNYFTTEESF